MRYRDQLCPCGVLLLLTLGCGRVYEYPDELGENSAEACADGEDGDLDGKTDCADPDCDGFCPERTRSQCEDGRDNDGDGLMDAADALCWLLLPPKTQRCGDANGVEVVDTFDAAFWPKILDPLRGAWPWWAWGLTPTGPELLVVGEGAHDAPGRADRRVTFAWTTYYADIPGSSLASLVRQLPFSGTFQDFELSFSAFVPSDSLLRAAIVPVDLAPSASAPLAGAENALLSVTVDTSEPSSRLTLGLSGAPYSQTIACAGEACAAPEGRLEVFASEGRFIARFTREDGTRTEVQSDDVHGAVRGSTSLPPSRLVFWGGTSDPGRSAWLDDLYLSVKPERPCGFAVPQIPGPVCESSGLSGAFGQSVSLARGGDGQYCALIAAAAADPHRGPTLPAPQALTTFGSPDGEAWTAFSSIDAPSIELPEGAELIGAGIAADEAGFHAAVTYRARGEVRLGFAIGESCEHWGTLVEGPKLFDDSEAPSYVIAEGRHLVYFTRPPGADPRTLWRVNRQRPDLPAESLAILPNDVGQPVSVTRIGKHDLVLVYPRAAEASNTSVGLLLSDARATTWQPAPQGAILVTPPRPDLWEGMGRVGFDDRGVVAATLAWDGEAGFLLYAGASTSGRIESARNEPLLAVGTARFGAATNDFANTTAIPDPCGDGACGAGETCANCEVDCPCGSSAVLTDAFAAGNSWQTFTDDPQPHASRYLTTNPPALNWLAGAPSWSVLPLDLPVAGDFELSFDWLARWAPHRSCSVYVGLGSLDLTSSGAEPPESGIFVRVKRDASCVDASFATPFVVSEGRSLDETDGVGACNGAEEALLPESTRRVVLRRQAGRLSVLTVAAQACGNVEQTVEDTGDSELAALIIGFGGGPFEPCAPTPADSLLFGMSGTVSNLEIHAIGGAP